MTTLEILKSLEHLEPMPMPCHAAAWSSEIHGDPALSQRFVDLRCSIPMRFEWAHLDSIPGFLSFNPEYMAISIRPFDAKFKKPDGTMHDWRKPKFDGEEITTKDSWNWMYEPPIYEYLDWVAMRAKSLHVELGDQKVVFLLGHETWTPHPVATNWLNEVVAILRSHFPDAEFAWSHWGRADNRYIGRSVPSDFGVAHLYYPPGSLENERRLNDAINAAEEFNENLGADGREMFVMARVPLGGCYENLSFTLKEPWERKRSANPFTPVQLGQTWELGEQLAKTVQAVTFWPGIGDDRIPNTWEHFRYFAEGMTGVRHSVED